MQKDLRLAAVLVLSVVAVHCTSHSASIEPKPRPVDPSSAAFNGTAVLAVIKSMEPKAYTDTLDDGSVLVSDVFVFSVVEPHDLNEVTVTAYFQGTPAVDGHVLKVGDFVRFNLPSGPMRYGILLQDLPGLRVATPNP
jgi:hypothetical protein